MSAGDSYIMNIKKKKRQYKIWKTGLAQKGGGCHTPGTSLVLLSAPPLPLLLCLVTANILPLPTVKSWLEIIFLVTVISYLYFGYWAWIISMWLYVFNIKGWWMISSGVTAGRFWSLIESWNTLIWWSLYSHCHYWSEEISSLGFEVSMTQCWPCIITKLTGFNSSEIWCQIDI